MNKFFCTSDFCHHFVPIFVAIFCHPVKGNQDIDPNIPVSSENDDATLSILVENSGRINYKLLNNAYMGLHKEGFFFALSNVSPPILSFLVGVDENMAQEWKIYSLPMDEEFLGTIKYDASLPLFVEGIVLSLIVCSL